MLDFYNYTVTSGSERYRDGEISRYGFERGANPTQNNAFILFLQSWYIACFYNQ